ncbi:MAG: hypothetical protein Q7S03_00695 [bacterium]|nr:hypothetical protein [bacterium]
MYRSINPGKFGNKGHIAILKLLGHCVDPSILSYFAITINERRKEWIGRVDYVLSLSSGGLALSKSIAKILGCPCLSIGDDAISRLSLNSCILLATDVWDDNGGPEEAEQCFVLAKHVGAAVVGIVCLVNCQEHLLWSPGQPFPQVIDIFPYLHLPGYQWTKQTHRPRDRDLISGLVGEIRSRGQNLLGRNPQVRGI